MKQKKEIVYSNATNLLLFLPLLLVCGDGHQDRSSGRLFARALLAWDDVLKENTC